MFNLFGLMRLPIFDRLRYQNPHSAKQKLKIKEKENTMRKIPLEGLQKYERYIPNAFDETLSIVEKVNKVINGVNEVGTSQNEVIEVVDGLNQWVRNDGLKETVNTRLDEMTDDGTLNNIINEQIFTELDGKVDTALASTYTEVVLVPSGGSDNQNYLDALGKLTGGGTIVFSHGTYTLGTVPINSNIKLVGRGNPVVKADVTIFNVDSFNASTTNKDRKSVV